MIKRYRVIGIKEQGQPQEVISFHTSYAAALRKITWLCNTGGYLVASVQYSDGKEVL